ncbi:MAG: pyruvate kinase [Planctomycetia bacterium]|nr:pyruvate kinase [Planctomycetia bacterium]
MGEACVLDISLAAKLAGHAPGATSSLRHTKIVATVGPACASPEKIRGLILAGVNVFRLNFSHSEHAWHERMLNTIRAVAMELRSPIAVLQDLCGPKIRLSRVPHENYTVREGDIVRITTEDRLVKQGADAIEFDLASTYSELISDVNPGRRLLLDDGKIELLVEQKLPHSLITRVTRGGVINRGKGMNLPGSELSTECMTEKDWRDLEWGIQHDVDYVALSFVRRPEDLIGVRSRLDDTGSPAMLIAKIERPEAVNHVSQILELADGLMVARGDLGLETDLARVPLLQKSLIELCRRIGKPVITATQVLESMINEATPTRAEVSDIANAIYDGTDAIMLSAETATGSHAEAAVTVIDRVARATESHLDLHSSFDRRRSHASNVSTAICDGAVATALNLDARRVVVYSHSGHTARLLTRSRLPMNIVAVTNMPTTYRQLALSYGVSPVLLPSVTDLPQLLIEMDRLVVEQAWGAPGDNLVIVSSLDGRDGHIDTLHVHSVARFEA